jgi:protein-arginine kinase activator protein McsA
MIWNDNDVVAVLKCTRCKWTFEHILLRGDELPGCEECLDKDGQHADTFVRSSRPYGVAETKKD